MFRMFLIQMIIFSYHLSRFNEEIRDFSCHPERSVDPSTQVLGQMSSAVAFFSS